MARCIVSRSAAADIASILAWTQTSFGGAARLRYEALLTQAINDLGANPKCSGRVERSEISADVFTYHLFHSRNHVPAKVRRVARPRHFLLCRAGKDGSIEIGRVIHDAMDLDRHLPANYRPKG